MFLLFFGSTVLLSFQYSYSSFLRHIFLFASSTLILSLQDTRPSFLPFALFLDLFTLLLSSEKSHWSFEVKTFETFSWSSHHVFSCSGILIFSFSFSLRELFLLTCRKSQQFSLSHSPIASTALPIGARVVTETVVVTKCQLQSMKTNKSMPICRHCFDFDSSSLISAFGFVFYFPLLHVNTSSVTSADDSFLLFFPISFPFIYSHFYSKFLYFFSYSILVLFLFCIVQFFVLLVLSSVHSSILSHPLLSLPFFFTYVLCPGP